MSLFQNIVFVIVLKYTAHGYSTHPRAMLNKDNTYTRTTHRVITKVGNPDD